nr:hypothetical protein [uncultured Flavobacterium sp.]
MRYSFVLIDNKLDFVIKNDLIINLLNTIGNFFLYSMTTFIVAGNSNKTWIFFQLFGIYSLCLLVSIIGFIIRSKFEVVVNRIERSVKIRGDKFEIDEFSDFFISDKEARLKRDFDLYGLYIKSNKYGVQLVYGYSVIEDIQKLLTEIQGRLNSR